MWTELQEKAVREVFHQLNSHEIRWLIIGDFRGLPKVNRTMTVEIIIHKEDMSQGKRLVKEAMASAGFQRYTQSVGRERCCYDFFCTQSHRIYTLRILLLCEISYLGAPLISFEDIYRDRVKNNNFYVPKEGIHGILLFIKSLIEAGKIKAIYKNIINLSLNNHEKEFYEFLYESLDRKTVDALMNSLKVNDLSSFNSNKQLNKAWAKKFMKSPVKTITGAIVALNNSIRHRLTRKKGSFSCFLGPDGVGKTTIISLLKQRTSEVFLLGKEEVNTMHLRPGYLPALGDIASRVSVERKQSNSEKAIVKSSGFVMSFIRMVYYWSDYIIGYYLMIRRSCLKGCHIIFDRYFYDFILDQGRARIKLPMFIRRAFLKLTPEPDIIFLLTCSAELIYERKQEMSIPEIKEYLENYESFGREDERFVLLDAAREPEQIVQEVLRILVLKSTSEL